MKRIFFVMCCVVGLSAACLDEPQDSKTNGLTKAEAQQQQKSDSRDLCDVFDWYGDGVCDDFCSNLDSDCGVSCLAAPACGDGQVEVESCDISDAGCTAPTICGQTIFCQENLASCQAYPSCGDKIEVSQCSNPMDVGAPGDCEEVEICGYTILCESQIVCEAIPVCPEGTVEVDSESCTDNESCTSHTTCGETIFCAPSPVACLALPVCPEDHTEVEACAVDVECQTATMCDTTIICQPNGM